MTCTKFFRVARHDLVYLKFIMEAHEGLATLSTADKLKGVVIISWQTCFTPVMESLLAALQLEIEMVETTGSI